MALVQSGSQIAQATKVSINQSPNKSKNSNTIIADPGDHMHLQASLGDVDFITGDYLAEVNIAENAQAHAAGQHPGWEQTA